MLPLKSDGEDSATAWVTASEEKRERKKKTLLPATAGINPPLFSAFVVPCSGERENSRYRSMSYHSNGW